MQKLLSKFIESAKELKRLRALTLSAMMAALFVAVSFLDIYIPGTQNMSRISFAFIAMALTAKLCGPIPAALVGAVGDILQNLLFPKGPLNPGITLCAFLIGLIFGIAFYKEKTGIVRCIIAMCPVSILVETLLKTYVLKVTFHWRFSEALILRAPGIAVSFVIMIVICYLVFKTVDRFNLKV